MDYKRVLRLHFVNHLSGREIAESCGDCSKTTVNEFLKRFRECSELMYPLSEDVTNEYIAGLLYKKSGIAADQLLYRDFNKEAVYKALARKGETLKHLWQKYNAVGIVDGKKPMSYRQYCRRYSEWADSKQLTFHIQRYPAFCGARRTLMRFRADAMQSTTDAPKRSILLFSSSAGLLLYSASSPA